MEFISPAARLAVILKRCSVMVVKATAGVWISQDEKLKILGVSMSDQTVLTVGVHFTHQKMISSLCTHVAMKTLPQLHDLNNSPIQGKITMNFIFIMLASLGALLLNLVSVFFHI